MSYQILKGWPFEGALDVVGIAATASPAVNGSVGYIKDDGTIALVNYAANAADNALMPLFVFDTDTLTGKVVGLASPAVIKIDSTMYDSGTYTPNVALTCKAGKFANLAGTERTVGRVIARNAVTGDMTIAFFGAIG